MEQFVNKRRVLYLRENQLNKTVNSNLAANLLLGDASFVQPFDLILTHEPYVACGGHRQCLQHACVTDMGETTDKCKQLHVM